MGIEAPAFPSADGHVEILFEGKAFRVPNSTRPDFILDRMTARRRFYEEDLLKYLHAATLSPGQIADCGANIGNHTLFFAGVMGRRTLAIEPIESNRRQLQRVVEANGIDHLVSILPVALGDRNGTVAMATPNAGNPGMFRIVAEGPAGETVPMTRLDDLLVGSEQPLALIKLDLEGYEEPALCGSMAAVERYRPLICAEFTSLDAFHSFFRHLDGLGYAATAAFCATPTVVFEQSRSPGSVAKGVEMKLLRYERTQAERKAAPA
jgi:FkbM family methyltransferase